jgi:hypothetical protein
MAYILVGNDLDILNMARGLEDLAEDILGHTLVQASNIQSSLIRFRGGSPEAA